MIGALLSMAGYRCCLRDREFRHRGFVEAKPAGPEWLGTSGVIQWCTAASSAA